MAAASSLIEDSFNALEKQRELIANCTLLWKDLTDHFSSIEKDLQIKSQNLKSKRQSLDLSTQQTLLALHAREQSIDSSVDAAIQKVEQIHKTLNNQDAEDDHDLGSKLRSFCKKMDGEALMSLITDNRKDVEVLKRELPGALDMCVDPGLLVLDVICNGYKKGDVSWACVLVLEALVYALEDREFVNGRMLVTRSVKERARRVAEEWKAVVGDGGAERVKAADVHAFLQHLVTFGVWVKEDREFYRKLVVGFSWRRQMPKLSVALGLKDQMADMIEELIRKGQKLDAINFAYEAGLQDKFPPVPLLKSYLKDSNKASALALKDANNSAQAVNNSNRKKQSALKAVMKCIEDRKLESEFPLEPLQKRLENLEKVRVNKKKAAGVNSPPINSPVNKRTRANNVGPMPPPAKAGRLTNNAYVSSFPSPPPSTYIHSPSSHNTYSPPYAYDLQIPHGVYGSISPQAIRDPYAYPSPPFNYHPYGYQQAYYR